MKAHRFKGVMSKCVQTLTNYGGVKDRAGSVYRTLCSRFTEEKLN